jgi:predicted RNase H-like HicB family nuclease
MIGDGMYIYEATIRKEDDGFFVEFDDIDAAYASGDTIADAVQAATETLRLVLAEHIDTGLKLPKPNFKLSSNDILRVAIAVDVTPDFIERSKCVSITEAAEELGVTSSRISHMLDAGILQVVPFGNERLVTIASINERKANPKKAGRPRKDIMTA